MCLLQHVRENNVTEAARMLSSSAKEAATVAMTMQQTCHPLCTCAKCRPIVGARERDIERSHVTVNSRDERGFTGKLGSRLLSFRWLSCLGWHSPSISALVYLFFFSRVVPSPESFFRRILGLVSSYSWYLVYFKCTLIDVCRHLFMVVFSLRAKPHSSAELMWPEMLILFLVWAEIDVYITVFKLNWCRQLATGWILLLVITGYFYSYQLSVSPKFHVASPYSSPSGVCVRSRRYDRDVTGTRQHRHGDRLPRFHSAAHGVRQRPPAHYRECTISYQL